MEHSEDERFIFTFTRFIFILVSFAGHGDEESFTASFFPAGEKEKTWVAPVLICNNNP